MSRVPTIPLRVSLTSVLIPSCRWLNSYVSRKDRKYGLPKEYGRCLIVVKTYLEAPDISLPSLMKSIPNRLFPSG